MLKIMILMMIKKRFYLNLIKFKEILKEMMMIAIRVGLKKCKILEILLTKISKMKKWEKTKYLKKKVKIP
jgi:hypothetical protein